MPIGIWNLEWLNSNSQRSYPLSEDATKTDTTGLFQLPDSIILGLYFPVHAGLAVEPEQFFISQITIFGTGINVSVSYNDGTDNPPIVASSVVSFVGHVEYMSYALSGAGDYDDSVGKVVFGKPDDLQDLPPGQYFFSYAAGKLDSDCIRPILRGVSSIVLVNGNDRSARLTGDIELNAGSNIRLSVSVTGGVSSIQIDAIDGQGLTTDCVCDNNASTSPCIRTINDVPPDNEGNFTLLGDSCIDIAGATNGLQMKDDCSSPCCGCAELEAVTSNLERFGEAATTLQNFLNRLEGSVNRMNLTVLGSRLNDQGCNTCS